MTNLLNFSQQNQFETQTTCTSKLSRPFRSLSATMSPDYVVNLREKGLFPENDGRLMELFTMFRAVTIHQATRFVLPQYSLEGHRVVAEMFARLYQQYFVSPVDLEARIAKDGHIPGSLAFILGPAGARYLASKHDKTLSDMGWTKNRLVADINYGLHNVYVTEIVIRLMSQLRMIQIDPTVNLELQGAGEFEGKLVATAAGNKVIARPDYTVQLKFFKDGGQPAKRTLFIEYDNGTEGMDTLRRKVIDFHLACTAASGVLAPVKFSSPVFIFNKENRAQKFVRDLCIWKQKFTDFVDPLYVGTLENVLHNGFFYPNWACVDMTVPPMQPEQMALPMGSEAEQKPRLTPSVSVFPEIDATFKARRLYEAIQAERQDDGERFLRLESEAFEQIAKEMSDGE